MKTRLRRIVEQALFDVHHRSVDRGEPRMASELLEAMGTPTDPIAKLNAQSLAGRLGRTNVVLVTEEGLWTSPS